MNNERFAEQLVRIWREENGSDDELISAIRTALVARDRTTAHRCRATLEQFYKEHSEMAQIAIVCAFDEDDKQ